MMTIVTTTIPLLVRDLMDHTKTIVTVKEMLMIAAHPDLLVCFILPIGVSQF
jgi:hypothetical protein